MKSMVEPMLTFAPAAVDIVYFRTVEAGGHGIGGGSTIVADDAPKFVEFGGGVAATRRQSRR
ncbi:hypothetical protein [Burkholderia anthina]|uniref:hypothetical protein n=1 Tax=Burkholderia anthina TaxID=179879 RepID=UPI001FC8A14C|nr:hypothetical protein [Burkholderia anthina]